MNRFTSHNPRKLRSRRLFPTALSIMVLVLVTSQASPLLNVAQARMLPALGTSFASAGRPVAPQPRMGGIEPQPGIDPLQEPPTVLPKKTELPKPTESAKGTEMPKATEPPRATMLPVATQPVGGPAPTLTSTGPLAPSASIV